MKEEYKGFIKYLKIKVLGDEENKDIFLFDDDKIVVEEKFDGANTRFFVKDGVVYMGTRNVIRGQVTEDKNLGKNYARSIKTFVNAIKGREKEFDRKIFFGETMIKHTLDYDWDRIPSIIMFDIYDVKTGLFLDLEEKTRIFKDLGLEQPSYRIFTSEELRQKNITDDFVPQSKYRSGQAEGVVFKNYKKQIFAKYVRDKFKEKNKLSFGSSKKFAKDDSERIVFAYITNARIEKNVYKLIDEGKKLEMPLMKYLPKQVWEDVVEEEGKEILWSNSIINFRRVRKLLARRCVVVLKQIITNNKLLNEEG